MDDRKREPAEIVTGDLGQPVAKRCAVIVAMTADQLPGPSLEDVEQSDVHPVAGVDYDIRVIDRPPDVVRQIPGSDRHVGIGKQQQAHVGPHNARLAQARPGRSG
jgi:hypothetical protein